MTLKTGNPLSVDALFERIKHTDKVVILCATHRLTRNLRLAFGQRQIERGETVWPTPQASTVDAWLSGMGEQIALLGEVPVEAIPDRVLSSFQECLVWKQSIESAASNDQPLDLFDLHSLAKTAAEAHALINTWQLRISSDACSDETQQFIGWRKRFNDICQQHGWVDVTTYQKRVLDWLEKGAGALPERVVFAGFDHLSPHLERLQAVLANRGVEIFHLESSNPLASTLSVMACDDAEAECRAAAAWAKKQLDAKPDARLGIVVADLEARRVTITPILDEALNPATLARGDDSAPTRYNMSLGLPLVRHGMVRAALELLRLLGRPQGLPLNEFGDLLRTPYWSADQSEADRRALIDACLRERPGQNLTIDSVLRVAKPLANQEEDKLVHHLSWLRDAQRKCAKTAKPSEWAAVFRETLAKAGWPGERSLSSTEFQTRAAFFEVLTAFAELDAFLGAATLPVALNALTRLCREKIFQPQTVGQPPVQVLGLLEANGAEFDALWVMGMNDQHWPPPARPNALLSAELQRRQGTPGASAEVQTRFARDIHQRLLRCAPDITFSYAQKEGERDLLPSPLLADLPESNGIEKGREDVTLASEIFAHVSENQAINAFEYLDDHLAPPLAAGEKVSGGSGLLKAQAVCPAWAFYRYRLGAKKLETPVEGFDASQRGTMVHAMLERFWKGIKDSASLYALSKEQLQETVAAAAEFALTQFETAWGEKLSATFRQLEANRLQLLCLEWLAVESNAPDQLNPRPPFKVLACEEKHTVCLGQLRINLVIDRIDELIEDGRRIVLDYKTGASLDTKNWFDDHRITEPQLPLYAAIVLAQPEQAPVAAVAFAKVRLRECDFQGIAADSGLLPGVNGLRLPAVDDDQAEIPLDLWQALLDSWKERLEAIAEEIRHGEAAVRYEDEKALAYCDVLPLLRLAERKLQFEKSQEAPQ